MATDHDPIDPAGPGAVRAALLDRTKRSWAELAALLDRLDERQLAAAGPDGWAAKDHLTHLARWEQYALAVLEGRDGRAELGLTEDVEGEEAENAVLHERDAGLTPGEARALLEMTQARMLAALRSVDPGLLVSQRAQIAGNTYEHIEEHAGWIRTLVGAAAN